MGVSASEFTEKHEDCETWNMKAGWQSIELVSVLIRYLRDYDKDWNFGHTLFSYLRVGSGK